MVTDGSVLLQVRLARSNCAFAALVQVDDIEDMVSADLHAVALPAWTSIAVLALQGDVIQPVLNVLGQ